MLLLTWQKKGWMPSIALAITRSAAQEAAQLQQCGGVYGACPPCLVWLLEVVPKTFSEGPLKLRCLDLARGLLSICSMRLASEHWLYREGLDPGNCSLQVKRQTRRIWPERSLNTQGFQECLREWILAEWMREYPRAGIVVATSMPLRFSRVDSLTLRARKMASISATRPHGSTLRSP